MTSWRDVFGWHGLGEYVPSRRRSQLARRPTADSAVALRSVLPPRPLSRPIYSRPIIRGDLRISADRMFVKKKAPARVRT